MLSLDEPLDLKLPSGLNRGSHRTSICAPLFTRARQLRTTHHRTAVITPTPSASPTKGVAEPCSPPAIDLSLSPSSSLSSSSSPHHSGSSLPSPQDGPPSPQDASCLPRDSLSSSYLEDRASPQGFPFFLPIGPEDGPRLPASTFIGQPCKRRASPACSSEEHLACRWMKCHLLFDSLQDLVDHVNNFHAKPLRDSGYCCQWEGCARKGRGFNARYKMLIHIRTHTNEKPHHCPTCNKSFSRLENLKIHTRSHTGEKPYICPYEGCSKRYSNSSDRFKHTRTHYVDKPYCCKMAGCLKRYTDPSSLRKHIKAHGHSVAQDSPSPASLEELLQTGQLGRARGALGASGTGLDSPYQGGGHFLLPRAAAALVWAHTLQGLRGPLTALCPHPLDLSGLGSPTTGLGTGELFPLPSGEGLRLGRGSLLPPLLSGGVAEVYGGWMGGGARDEEDEEKERPEKIGQVRGDNVPSWVVFPPGMFLLNPTVVN